MKVSRREFLKMVAAVAASPLLPKSEPPCYDFVGADWALERGMLVITAMTTDQYAKAIGIHSLWFARPNPITVWQIKNSEWIQTWPE